MSQQQAAVVRLERTYQAPIERVRAAWTDPALLARWFCPPDMRATVHSLDARVGGQYEITMTGEDGAHTCTGTYREVADDRIVMTWNWTRESLPNDSLLTVTFHTEGGATRLVLEHTGLPTTEAATHHEQGWNGCLDNLHNVL